ncbi:hypothetical protein [Variovorax sp. RCC_210]|uniref:hypothetical protein n=1 Tax=Variovorax sp. RCC_210 TaxID=3239217 RepID=UPI0035240EBC
MRPDLPQEDVDALVRRHDELTRATRTLYRLDPDREPASSSPFELMVEVAKGLFTMVAIATVAVVLVAIALAELLPAPIP